MVWQGLRDMFVAAAAEGDVTADDEVGVAVDVDLEFTLLGDGEFLWGAGVQSTNTVGDGMVIRDRAAARSAAVNLSCGRFHLHSQRPLCHRHSQSVFSR